MVNLNNENIGFEELANIIFFELKAKLENSKGLAIFAKERSKFEDWLKVELIDTLSKHIDSKYLYPEKNFRKIFPNSEFNSLFTEERFIELFGKKRDYKKKTKKSKNFDLYIEPTWLLELKTTTTNYKKVLPKNGNFKSSRSDDDNVKEIVKDVQVLKKIDFKNKAVLFVVFPLDIKYNRWYNKHLKWINEGDFKLNQNTQKSEIQLLKTDNFKILKEKEFRFSNNVPGIIYFGLI